MRRTFASIWLLYALLGTCYAQSAAPSTGCEDQLSQNLQNSGQYKQTTSPTKAVREFVAANYGSGFSICAFSGYANLRYLAVCGKENHGDPQIDLYILSDNADDIVASTTGLSAHGSQVAVQPVGKTRLTFVVTKTEMARGYQVGSTTIYDQIDDDLVDVLHFVSLADNNSSSECKENLNVCEHVTRRLGDWVGSGVHPDVEISESRVHGGRESNKRYRVRYNGTTKKYAVPQELLRSF